LQDFGWTEELILSPSAPNSGVFVFSADDVNCESDCREKTVGAVVVEAKDSVDPKNPA